MLKSEALGVNSLFTFDSKSFSWKEAGGQDGITVPDASLLFTGDYKRVGDDLKLTGANGEIFLITDYFKAEKRATLYSTDGASLTPDIVDALSGGVAPGQYAQAGGAPAAAAAIGRVAKVEGNATVIRNGVAITLNVGDAILKGDVAQTGSNSALGLIFADGTTFSLTANARMVLNDFVYSSGGSNNSALFSLVQGSMTFIAGQVAKTGDMRVDTPVVTMGIRGTAVHVEIDVNLGTSKLQVLIEPGGVVGSFNLYNKTTGALLGTVSQSNIGWLVTPAGTQQVSVQQLPLTPNEIQQALNAVQEVFNVQQIGNQLLQQSPVDPNAPSPNRTDNTKGTEGITQPLIVISNNGGLNGNQPTITVVTPTITDNNPAPVIPGPIPGEVPQEETTTPPAITFVAAPVVAPVVEAGVGAGNAPNPGTPIIEGDLTPGEAGGATVQAVTPVSEIVHGTLSVNADGTFTYTLDNDNPIVQALAEGEVVEDVFSYTIKDAAGNITTATLTIKITGTNDAPVAVADVNSGTEDSEIVTGNVLTNDTDVDHGATRFVSNVVAGDTPGENLGGAGVFNFVPTQGLYIQAILGGPAFTIQGEHGTLEMYQNGDYAYFVNDSDAQHLAVGEVLSEVFTYTVMDEHGATSTAKLTITITGTNDAPVAEADVNTVKESGVFGNFPVFGDNSAGGNVLANDTDVDHNAVKTVAGVIAGTTDATQVNGGVGAFIQGTYGTLKLLANGSYFYALNNASAATQGLTAGEQAGDVFTYMVTDEYGATSMATLTITVFGTNDAPVIWGGATFGQVYEEGVFSGDAVATGTLFKFDVDNDDDFTNDTWSVVRGAGQTQIDSDTVQGKYGALSVNSNGVWTYELDNSLDATQALGAGDTRWETFTVKVTDTHGASDWKTVTVKVNGTNDAPVITGGDIAGTVYEEGAFSGEAIATGTLLKTDVDANDNAANDSWSIIGQVGQTQIDSRNVQGKYGALSVDDNGNWTYVLDNNLQATQSLGFGDTAQEIFTVVVTDQNGASAPQTVTVTVNGSNDAPTAHAETVITNVAAGTTIHVPSSALLRNDTDPEGDQLFVPDGDSVAIVVANGPGQTFNYIASDGAADGFGINAVKRVDGRTLVGTAGDDVFIIKDQYLAGHTSTIDNLSSWNGTQFINQIGEPNSAYYAQSFVALSEKPTSLQFKMADDAGSDATSFKVLLTTVTGTGANTKPSQVLFESQMYDLPNGAGWTNIVVPISNVTLVPGQTYQWIIDAYSGKDGAVGTARVAVSGTYADGAFSFANATSGTRESHFAGFWSNWNPAPDLAFSMSFEPPAPTTLTGGTGADTFVFKTGNGAAVITDFSGVAGHKDIIDLSGFDGIDNFAELQALLQPSNVHDTQINLGNGDILTLQNVLHTALTASDFVFHQQNQV